MTGALLAAALRYAAAGWPVFPCHPDGTPEPRHKAPLTPNGFKDAATAPGVIRGWWRRWPAANVAIATGAPGPDVLDVDTREGGSGFAAFNRLKRAGLLAGARALVRTPSGGLHAYYAGTGQSCGRLPRHYLDFKAAGGYVLAPPSVVLGSPYQLLDHRGGADGRLDWQAAACLLDPPKPPARPHGNAAGDIGKLAAWVAGLRQGNRNSGLFWAACRAAESGHNDLSDLAAAAVQAGLDEPEARRTIASAAGKTEAR